VGGDAESFDWVDILIAALEGEREETDPAAAEPITLAKAEFREADAAAAVGARRRNGRSIPVMI